MKLLLILLFPLASCITITKNYYPKEIVKCDHKCPSPILFPQDNMPFYGSIPSFTNMTCPGRTLEHIITPSVTLAPFYTGTLDLKGL